MGALLNVLKSHMSHLALYECPVQLQWRLQALVAVLLALAWLTRTRCTSAVSSERSDVRIDADLYHGEDLGEVLRHVLHFRYIRCNAGAALS